ncbi:MAG: 4Fe-4S ferredoxin [Deltaproteobacteria bacterium HGW-Deltaproteobacteria-9]|nr:MAG: 4Fe-4S ferredoxin [Deltaproteobacteria bacterium HGW-Deltaproteobacteria-9]
MSHQDLYRELSKKVGTENSQIVPEIWKTVCTPEEATLLNVLPATIEELVRRFEKTQDAIAGMLQVLFHKGLVFKATREGKTVYRMPKHIIQFHDASTLWPEAPPELIELWRQYTEKEYPQIPAAITAMKIPPFFRVVPINEKIEVKSQVLVYEDAASIVEKASVIAVTNCPCRMIMRKCDKPIDVCLQLNRGAEYAIERGTGRKIDVAEAKSILRRAEEAGLVHLTENKAGIGTVICNCCNCCCVGLPYAKNAATSGMLVPSRYRAVVAGDACTGCGLCVDDCPMAAISIDEQNIAMIDAEACIGCGVCTHVCPTDAISLTAVRQEDFIPA